VSRTAAGNSAPCTTAGKQVRHRHVRHRRHERMLLAHHGQQRDVAAVAPAHDPTRSGSTCGRFSCIHCVGRHVVVDLVAAVVDGVVVRLAVTGAAAVLRRDDDVPALHRLTDERPVDLRPVAVYAAVHPDQSRMAPRAPLLQRLVHVRRDVQVADAAAVRDLAVIQDAPAARLEDAVRARLRRNVLRIRLPAGGLPAGRSRRAAPRAHCPSRSGGPAPARRRYPPSERGVVRRTLQCTRHHA
jgi:hypothetical protein